MAYSSSNTDLEQEPIGIVISGGSRVEQVPSVFAYVWAPAPEADEDLMEVLPS